MSSKRTPTFVVSLLLFLSALFPLSSLSQVFCIHGHTHTHTHARTSLWAKLSFPLIHLLVCIFLFPFTSRFAGTIASPLFTAHTLSLSSSSLLLLHVTPNTLSVLLVFFFFYCYYNSFSRCYSLTVKGLLASLSLSSPPFLIDFSLWQNNRDYLIIFFFLSLFFFLQV